MAEAVYVLCFLLFISISSFAADKTLKILKALGIDPQNLKSVCEEKTKVLPALGLD